MSDTDAIRGMYSSFDAAATSGDVDAWLAVQTEDCVWLPPDRGAVVGKAAVRTYVDDVWFGPNNMDLTNSPEEIVLAGDSNAWVRGTWKMLLSPKDGSDPSNLAGTFLSVLRRESGAWKLARGSFTILD